MLAYIHSKASALTPNAGEFLAFLHLRFFIATAWHMQGLIVGWYAYWLTHDPLTLASIGMAEAIPAIGMALPMGYWVDNWDKRKAMWAAIELIILSAAGTCYLVHDAALATWGQSSVLWGLLAMIMLNGTARSMYGPAMFSTLGRIVPRENIARASAMSSTMWQTAMVGGPMLGGLLYGLYDVEFASYVVLGLMLLGSCGTVWISAKPPVKQDHKAGMIEDLTLGIRFIVSRPVIFGALSLDLLAVLFGGVVALLPVFATDILFVDQRGLGLLRASMSIGSIIMMALLSWKPLGKNAGRQLLWAVAGFGLCILGFASSTWFWLSFATLLLAGAFDAVSVIVRHTILQLETPEDMKGRVAAANTMFISSSNELGAVESGVVARLLGTVPSVYIGALLTLFVVAFTATKNPALRRMSLGDKA
ncbi:MAG: MFS transporter [Ignavibacteria bacterium]|nr:MFS transporter [Ignavibacteria bacterium]